MGSEVQQKPANGVSVLICGAGVGGLTAALECWRAGCDVKIIERTKSSSVQGDSFFIGPSALDFFKHWPWLKQRNKEISYEPLVAIHNIKGELMRGPMALAETEGGKVARHMRPKFHSILLEQLRMVGIEVQFDSNVMEYFENDCGAGVVLQDGSRIEADLVIAADGVRSASTAIVNGRPVPAKSSGQAVFRAAYPAELAISDPMIAKRFPYDPNEQSCVQVFAGPDMLAVFWRNDQYMVWAIQHVDNRGLSKESWSHRVHPDEVLRFTATLPGWPEVADRVIKATPPDKLMDWALMWRDPQPKWTSPNGYIVQLGDTAHTFLPTSRNGATQAIEDAVSIGACVSMTGKDNIPYATRIHNLLRFERVSFTQAMGVRNLDLRNTKSKEGAKFKAFNMGAWLVEHDPEKYVYDNYDSALSHLVSGTPFTNTNTPPGIPYQPWTFDSLQTALKTGEKSIVDGGWC